MQEIYMRPWKLPATNRSNLNPGRHGLRAASGAAPPCAISRRFPYVFPGKIAIVMFFAGIAWPVPGGPCGSLLRKAEAGNERNGGRCLSDEDCPLHQDSVHGCSMPLRRSSLSNCPGAFSTRVLSGPHARHLGLDEEQTIADYLEAAGETAPTRLEVTSEVRILPHARLIARSPTQLAPWGMLAAGLLILALVLSVWSYFRRGTKREASAPEPVRAAAAPSSNDNGQSAATSQSPPGQNAPAQHPPSAHPGREANQC